MPNKHAQIIAGFPGIGKSHAEKTLSSHRIVDLDSSQFEKSDFPDNYIAAIKEHSDNADIIFVSSHKEVRDALKANSMPFTLVYPAAQIKQDYLQRYAFRGNTKTFIKFIEFNWDDWIEDMMHEGYCERWELEEGEFLTDALRMFGVK